MVAEANIGGSSRTRVAILSYCIRQVRGDSKYTRDQRRTTEGEVVAERRHIVRISPSHRQDRERDEMSESDD